MTVLAVCSLILAGCDTKPTTSITDTSAVFNGAGGTGSSPTHYYFEYATSTADFGTARSTKTPTRSVPANIPDNTPFSEGPITGLNQLTTYYVRVCGAADGQTDQCDPSPESFTTQGTVPSQFIVKLYTEGLGRTLSGTDFTTRLTTFKQQGCSLATVRSLAREIYTSAEFTGLGYDRGAALVALYRGTLNRELDSSAYNTYGDAQAYPSWSSVVDAVLASSSFTSRAATVCDASKPSDYFDNSVPAYQLPVSGSGFQGTQQQLQSQLDATAAAGGGTVTLAARAVITVGDSQGGGSPLTVPAGVSLVTSGAPGVQHYVDMARIVRASTTCAVAAPCGSGVVVVNGGSAGSSGGTLSHVWVDGRGGVPPDDSARGGKVVGVTSGSNSTVSSDKLSAPIAGANVLGLLGYDTDFHTPCVNTVVSDNLLTAYTTDHIKRNKWGDGITDDCEDAHISGNAVVDASDVGIVVFGHPTRTQKSSVFLNVLVNVGNSAFGGLVADPAGFCGTVCTDKSLHRSFTGMSFSSNTLMSGTHVGFGLAVLLGIRPFSTGGPDGEDAAAVNNSAVAGTRADVGVGVSGMFNASLTGNSSSFDLQPIDSCPLVNVGASVSANRASFAGTPQPYQDVVLSGCW